MPTHTQTYYNLGVLLLNAHQTDKAIDAFLHVRNLTPKDTENLLGLALSYETQGDTIAAQNTYQQILIYMPNHTIAQEKLVVFSNASNMP